MFISFTRFPVHHSSTVTPPPWLSPFFDGTPHPDVVLRPRPGLRFVIIGDCILTLQIPSSSCLSMWSLEVTSYALTVCLILRGLPLTCPDPSSFSLHTGFFFEPFLLNPYRLKNPFFFRSFPHIREMIPELWYFIPDLDLLFGGPLGDHWRPWYLTNMIVLPVTQVLYQSSTGTSSRDTPPLKCPGTMCRWPSRPTFTGVCAPHQFLVFSRVSLPDDLFQFRTKSRSRRYKCVCFYYNEEKEV